MILFFSLGHINVTIAYNLNLTSFHPVMNPRKSDELTRIRKLILEPFRAHNSQIKFHDFLVIYTIFTKFRNISSNINFISTVIQKNPIHFIHFSSPWEWTVSLHQWNYDELARENSVLVFILLFLQHSIFLLFLIV